MSAAPKILSSLALFALVAAPAHAADNAKEVATAATHAGLAAGARDPQMVKAHLHHVLNCLEGPEGADFAAAAANPCGGMGKGAIPDAAADKKAGLEQAVNQAKQALAETNIDKAKEMAAKIQTDLGK